MGRHLRGSAGAEEGAAAAGPLGTAGTCCALSLRSAEPLPLDGELRGVGAPADI